MLAAAVGGVGGRFRRGHYGVYSQ